MPTAQEIYNTLVQDPDLEIGKGQTREQAAEAEAQYRARQFMNNVQALSLATQDDDEPSSSLKALANHIKSIGKTMVGGTISIVQDIIKEKLYDIINKFSDNSQYLEVHPAYKNKIASFDDNGKELFNTLLKSNINPTVVGGFVNALHDLQTTSPSFYEDENWVHSVINKVFSDSEFAQTMGFTPDTITKLHEDAEFSNAYPGSVPEPPPYKEESVKADTDYGKNPKKLLATPASVKKVNEALNKTSWGKGIEVGMGTTGKLKIQSTHADNLFNPFPSKSAGRIYNSYVNGENPTDQDDTIDSTALGTYSVADMMNAIMHLQAQPTEKQEEAAEEKQAQTNKDVEEDTSAFKEATQKLKTVPIGSNNIGKPHVAFGSWGREKFTKFGKKKGVQHNATSLGIMHGLVNEFGQFTPVGQALIDDMYDKGLIDKSDVYNAETHGVVSASGMQKIIDHHGLQNPTVNEEIAKKIAGDNYEENIADKSTFDAIAGQIAEQMPEGGAEPTSQDVINDTSEAIDVPTQPDTGNALTDALTKYNAVMGSGNASEGAKIDASDAMAEAYMAASGITGDNPSFNSVEQTSKYVKDFLDPQHHAHAFDYINDSAPSSAQGVDIIPEDVAEKINVGSSDDDGEEFGKPDSTTPPTEQTTPEQSTSTTPPKQPKTSSETKKTKVMDALFGDDIDSEEAQIYADHLDDNPNELDSAYKQHVISEIVNKQKQKAKDAVKAKADEEKASAKAKADEEKFKQKQQLEEQKAKAKAEADELKQKKIDANVLPHDIPALKTDKEGNPTNKMGNAEATHKALELIVHKKLNDEHMNAATKKKLENALMTAKEHGADFEKIATDYNNMGDDFGSAEHMKQALTDMKDLHTAHALHDDIISGEGEHAKTLEHAFNQGAANHYGNSISDDGKITQDGKPHHDSKTAVYDGEHSHDVHALTHSSPFEKEQLKKYKQAKSEGDKNGMAKAKKALEDSGFNMKHLEAHEDDVPKSGPPDPEVAAKKMAEGYVWHEETRHWILKDTLEEIHGGHGAGNASIVNAGHTDKGGNAFATDEHGNASGTQFVLHGDKNLHAIGSGEKPKGTGAHYQQLTGNALKQNLGAAIDAHNQKGVGVTKLKGFDSNSGKLAKPKADGGISDAWKTGVKEGKEAASKKTGKIGSAWKKFKATYGKEGNYGKGFSQSDKTDDTSMNKSLDYFIQKFTNPHDDRMKIRELIEQIEEDEEAKKVKKGYNR